MGTHPGQPGPRPDRSFSKEIFPNIQPKPPIRPRPLPQGNFSPFATFKQPEKHPTHHQTTTSLKPSTRVRSNPPSIPPAVLVQTRPTLKRSLEPQEASTAPQLRSATPSLALEERQSPARPTLGPSLLPDALPRFKASLASASSTWQPLDVVLGRKSTPGRWDVLAGRQRWAHTRAHTCAYVQQRGEGRQARCYSSCSCTANPASCPLTFPTLGTAAKAQSRRKV